MEEITTLVLDGVVKRIDDDFTCLEITDPDGSKTEEIVETHAIQEAGIEVGNKIKFTFKIEAEPGEVRAILTVKDLGPGQTPEEIKAEVDEIMADADLDLIRTKFGAHT